MDLDNRHPSVQHVMQFFHFDHLPEGRMRTTSAVFADVAERLISDLIDGPELTECLRALVRAKDSAVRQAWIMDRLEGKR